MISHKIAPSLASSTSRLDDIARARHALLDEHSASPVVGVAPWVKRSWRRCMDSGLQASRPAVFEVLSEQQMRRTADANAQLVHTARPLLETLGRAMVHTRYFAILTNAQGVVIDVSGAIDRSDPRADLITRIGTDLSERAMGTTAIGTALAEQQPVWLHRGEHFFSNTSHYSCAGAPVTGPDGRCVGMLDLTGIDALERPELRHLVTQTAGKIENALVLVQPHCLVVRLNWPGNDLGSDSDGMLCLDADGWITAANPVARQMVPGLSLGNAPPVHASEVFGLPFELLFDQARRRHGALDVPLWSGLRLQALPVESSPDQHLNWAHAATGRTAGAGLKDMETALIRRAVDEARGNVAQAAQALGISRATVYRKLGKK